MLRFDTLFPLWAADWLDLLVPATQVAVTVSIAVLLHYGLRTLISRSARLYNWPLELVVPIKGLLRWFLIALTVLMCLEIVGVSAMVLWTAFSGFAAVGAVAFFAAWSVLSNFFCAFLIMAVRPYRLGDTIEVLEGLDKAGVRGRVIDINMLYTTLEEEKAANGERSVVQLPNIFIFQKGVRRIVGQPTPRGHAANTGPVASGGVAILGSSPIASDND